MRDRENILAVAELLPEYMGFIFYKESPRYVGGNFELPSGLPESIKKVGVFVNESAPRMIEIARNLKLDYLQLHGYESVEKCELLRSAGFRVIKVFSVDDNFDFEGVEFYEDVVDFFLFDTKGKYYGGNAVPFDWQVLSKYEQKVSFFLSGGITLENVNDIGSLRNANLHAIDVNSGVESKPGMKDLKKLKSLIEKIRKHKI